MYETYIFIIQQANIFSINQSYEKCLYKMKMYFMQYKFNDICMYITHAYVHICTIKLTCKTRYNQDIRIMYLFKNIL